MKNLQEITKFYHDMCDDYDNKVCSWINKHWESMPINSKEMVLINKNAKLQLMIAYTQWHKIWLKPHEIMRWIQQSQ